MGDIEHSEPVEVVCPTCRRTLQVVPGHNAARHVVPADAPCRACLEAQAVEAEHERIVTLIRELAEEQDYATMCSWRALADRLTREWSL